MGVERWEAECWAPDVELKHDCSRYGNWNWLVATNSIVDVGIRGCARCRFVLYRVRGKYMGLFHEAVQVKCFTAFGVDVCLHRFPARQGSDRERKRVHVTCPPLSPFSSSALWNPFQHAENKHNSCNSSCRPCRRPHSHTPHPRIHTLSTPLRPKHRITHPRHLHTLTIVNQHTMASISGFLGGTDSGTIP
jgi:hypothetical protein